MHIPENYLSPVTCGVMTAVMVPVWGHAIKNVKRNLPKESIPLLGVSAAFSFMGMMFNVPLVGGSTGHAVGGTLIALLLGPDAACISVSIALLIQALLFGDGGILAFGANCFNMAFVLPYAGYYIYRLVSRLVKSEKGEYLGAAIGSYVGINLAALCAAVEFGIQPYLYTDAAGNALYCPYGLFVSVPAMMIGHLTVFGLVELMFTTLIFAFVRRTSPKFVAPRTEIDVKPLFGLLATLIALVPIGLLAEGTAWGEWGVDEIAEVISNGEALGYTPSGMLGGFSWTSPLPDYTLGSLGEVPAYYLSAVIGVAILIIVFRLLAMHKKSEKRFE